jgi:RNA polymerase sigma-32 factor
VAKIAMGYRGYGLPVGELIAEGNVGMMQAVKRFEPDRGFRLSTYAMWWIRAAIQEYILRSWSLVKIGTTAAQKKLFFNLRRLKGQMAALEEGDLQPEQVAKLRALAEVMLRDLGDGTADAPGVRDLGRVANPQPMIHSDGHVRSGMDGVAKVLP